MDDNVRYFLDTVSRSHAQSDEQFVTNETRSLAEMMLRFRLRIRAMRAQLVSQKETIIGQLERIEELQAEKDALQKQNTILARTADRLTKAKGNGRASTKTR